MKRTNKNINRSLHYLSLLEDNQLLRAPVLFMAIKEIILGLKEEIFRYRARIGRLKNEIKKLNKIIGELNGSSS